MNKPIVTFDSESESGNIFYILAETQKTLPKDKAKECGDRVKKSLSYREALKIIREYVDLIDIKGIF